MVPRRLMLHSSLLLLLLLLVGGLLAGACAPAPAPATAEAGAPVPGLAATELTRFQVGRALFDKVFTPEDGLGPLFNENQCSACHTEPASGGTTGFERIVKATRYEAPGSCDLLVPEGGENVRSQATPLLRASGIERQAVPPTATEIGRFLPTALFGLGLVEAIDEEDILSREDPHDEDEDGVSGRAGRTADGRLARFGRKADVATIREFTEHALHLEMGLTSPSRLDDEPNHRGALSRAVDPAADPEVDSLGVDLMAAFVRFLAAPEQAAARSRAHGDTVAAGRRLFHRLGCTGCHVPSMRTASSDVAALDRRKVELYSDLLLHDMGPGLANVCAGSASPTELRTAMLMGLRHRSFLLHDGRASDLREAILAHGGEAQRAREAFAQLRWIEQEVLLEFLRSL